MSNCSGFKLVARPVKKPDRADNYAIRRGFNDFCMAQVRPDKQAQSPIFRLDNPELLDLKAIETAAAATQRGAWRFLADLFEGANKRHCQQLSIEPDASVWRIRYRTGGAYDEHVVSDSSNLIWATESLQTRLWGEHYHEQPQRTARFTLLAGKIQTAVTMRAIQTVNGDFLEFDFDPILPMPPLLDELGFQANQLNALRARLKRNNGTVLITSCETHQLNDTLLAINQELISPTLKLLSVNHRHRYSLPRTTQIDLHHIDQAEHSKTWNKALDTSHDILLVGGNVPETCQERIANASDQGVLTVQALQTGKDADLLQVLNAGIVRRAPLHRTVDTVVNHYAVRTNCPHCVERSILNDYEQHWLEQLRTPVTENVVSWLTDGNTEQFMRSVGCDECADSANGEPLSVYEVLERDQQNHLFPCSDKVGANSTGFTALQRQLMTKAKEGKVSLSEVIRVLNG